MKLLRRAYLELIGYTGALERFREACETTFEYLVGEFGFATGVYELTRYGALIRFEKPNSTVEIHLDWREERIFVYLRPGSQYDGPAKIDQPGVLLDAVMLRHGKTPPDQQNVTRRGRLNEILEVYANALRLHASDALRGDFSDIASVRAAYPESRWRTWGSTGRT